MTSFNTKFSTSNLQTESEMRLVNVLSQADITFSLDCASIILRGIVEASKNTMPNSVMLQHYSIMVKITETALNAKAGIDTVTLPCTRIELQDLKEIVSSALTYMEHIREEEIKIKSSGTPEEKSIFSIDLYILAKMLLLDIREQLSITIVSI